MDSPRKTMTPDGSRRRGRCSSVRRSVGPGGLPIGAVALDADLVRAVRAHDVDLEQSGDRGLDSVARERDLGAVGRPGRVPIAGRIPGETLECAGGQVLYEDLTVEVRQGALEQDLLAIGREARMHHIPVGGGAEPDLVTGAVGVHGLDGLAGLADV